MKRICYCIEGLYNSRGTERVLTQCANMLSEDYDITVVTAFQDGRNDYYPLCSKIVRVDLDVSEHSNNSFFHNPRKREYMKKLKAFLLSNRFDVVISTGGQESHFLHKIKDGSKKILWFHFAFDISNLFVRENHKGRLADLMVWLQTKRRVYFARKMDRVVVISKADCQRWTEHCSNVTYIYNPITITPNGVSTCDSTTVISVGVLGVQKGFDYLIDAWREVNDKHPDWHLDIFGEGPDREKLQQQIELNGLHDKVFLRGKTATIESEYQSHSIYAMSSRAEGFGLVLVEAASCGLPLISFDCNYGPNEIISNGENGILVNRVGDVNGLANAIIQLIEDANERKRMGMNAKRMSSSFGEDEIKKHWISLFEEMTKI